MKFDERKVVSYLDDNLDDRWIGMEGYFATNEEDLQDNVENEFECCRGIYIKSDCGSALIERNGCQKLYDYFYPIEK